MPDHRFTIGEQELNGKGSGRRKIGKEDYQAEGVIHVPAEARFSHLLSLPEGEIIELYHGRIYDPACVGGTCSLRVPNSSKPLTSKGRGERWWERQRTHQQCFAHLLRLCDSLIGSGTGGALARWRSRAQ